MKITSALMITMDVNHPDVLDFIQVKRDLTKVTGANISIKLNDEFMIAVEKEEDYILRFPCTANINNVEHPVDYNELFTTKLEDGTKLYMRRIKAKEYWDEIVKSAHGSAEPGLLFWDNVIRYSPDGVYDKYRPVSTNPCAIARATLLTPNGITTMGEIKIGDTIWSSEGWTTVINKWSNGVKDAYSYRTNAGEFLGTPNHRLVSNGIKTEAKDCKNVDSLTYRTFEREKEYDYNAIMDGLVIGDGTVKDRKNNVLHNVLLCVGKNDTDYFNYPALVSLFEKAYDRWDKWIVKTSIEAHELPKTYDRVIPERYVKADPDTVASFLRGLYSANGSVVSTYSNDIRVSNRVTLKTSSKELAYQVVVMLSSLGIRSYITTNKSKTVTFRNGDYVCKESYDVNISTDRFIFAKTIGFLQEYKNAKIGGNVSTSTRTTYPVVDVQYISTEEVFDITVDNESHTYWTGGLNVSNCGEIPLDPNNSCRLMAVNLYSFVKDPFTPFSHFSLKNFYEVSYEAMRLSDNLVDLELEAVTRIINKIKSDPESEDLKRTELELWQKAFEAGRSSRRTGLGFTALGDALAAMGLDYDSEDALKQVREIMYMKMTAELDCTIDMAIQRGTFTGWNPTIEKNAWYKMIKEEFPNQYERMNRFGRRNVSFNTVAPTGTVSLMTQTTSGVEPLFQPFYIRRKKVTSKHAKVDFVDELGDKWTEHAVLHPKFQDWIRLTFKSGIHYTQEGLEEAFKQSPYFGNTANDIDWIKRVEMQSVIQKYITHSISSTINLPETVSLKEVSKIYFEAWKHGLKGVTVYRNNSRAGVLVDKKSDKLQAFEYKDAVKRPDTLDAEAHVTHVAGKPFSVFVGLIDRKPYEVFCYEGLTREGGGTIAKKGRGNYEFTATDSTRHRILTGKMSEEQEVLTRLISGSLRHGRDIKFIVEDLNKSSIGIFSFSSAIARVLKKYIPDGSKSTIHCSECGSSNVIFTEGCSSCLECGSSKCG